MATRRSGTLADEVDGIGISHDGGITWRVQDFDFGEPSGGLQLVIYENNRCHIVGTDNDGDGLVLQSLRI